MIMDYLIHEGGFQTLTGNHCTNEPHEESKQEVEGDEEAKEASDVGHPPVMHGTRDKILAKDDIRSSRYILLSVQTPVGVYRFTQQGFCGRPNLPLVFCHSATVSFDMRNNNRLSLVGPHKSNRISEELSVNIFHSRIIPKERISNEIFNFKQHH